MKGGSNLGRQFAFILGAGFLLYMTLLSFINSGIIKIQFRALEARVIEGNLDRFMATLKREEQALYVAVKSYAEWLDTYDYMETFDEDYIAKNYNEEWLATQDIDFVSLIDLEGKVVWTSTLLGGDFDMDAGFLESLRFEPGDPRVFPEGWETKPTVFKTGFAATPNGPLLYCANTITDDYAEFPARGICIFGRIYDKDKLNVISPGPDVGIEFMMTTKPVKQGTSMIEEDRRVIYRDFGRTGEAFNYTLKFSMNREMEEAGQWLVLFIMIAAAVASFSIIASSMVFMEKNVTSRIGLFRDHLNSFTVSMDDIGELSEAKRDELGELARHINALTRQVIKQNADLENLANTDQLTGLANRRLFTSHFERENRRLARNQAAGRAADKASWFSIILADVDYFKHYNDTYGHVAGDVCLKNIAETLKACVHRPEDLVCRFGGEEFVIALPETDEPGAVSIAQKVIDMLAAAAYPHSASSIAPYVTISLGIATVKVESGILVDSLVEKADKALYSAKNAGRNTYVCYRE